jgi:hypothetical protein
MKRIASLLMLLCGVLSVCYSLNPNRDYDFPAGVQVDYFGLMITSSVNMNIRHDIDINHPAITALPHYEYLRTPIALGLEGSGQADITITENWSYPFVSAYYGSTWHKAIPYTEIPCSDIVLNQIDFDAGSEVILLFCKNDPFMQVIFDSFTAVYNEAEPNKVSVSWTTASETGLSSFRLFAGRDSTNEQSEYLGLIPATNTDQPHTYSYDVNAVQQGFTYYFWLKLVDNLQQGGYYGPVSVAVGPPYVPQNLVYPVVPNPCDDEFWCAYGVKDSSLVSILLLDAENNVVKEICHKVSVLASSRHMQRVQVFDLPEGLYRIYYWFEQEDGPFYSYGDVLIDRD